MDSHYVGRRLCTLFWPRTCMEARDSEEGKNPISLLRGRVETCHAIEPRPSLGVLAHILDVQQLPKVARLRRRAETPNYLFSESVSWMIRSNYTPPRPHKIILRFRACFREMEQRARGQK